MKTLYWLGGIVLAFGIILTVTMSRMPGANIVGISQSSSSNYSETVVLMRDGSFEQYFTLGKSGQVWSNKGSWVDASKDQDSQLFLAQTGTKVDGQYLNLRHKIEPNLSTKMSSSLEPAFSYRPLGEKDFEKIENFRKTARPFKQ